MSVSPIRARVILLIILVAASIPYVVGLGTSTLWDANESFYAETARNMVESGDYINPSFNARPRFNKPVLPYWIVAASYNIFGVSELSERLPIALGGLVLVATAFGLGKLLGSVNAGLLAAIVLATAPRFLMFSRRIIIDVHLAMFAGLTLLCFALAEAHPHRRKLYLVMMYLAAAFGVLTKGPVAVVLPGSVFLLYFVLEHRLTEIRRMLVPVGVVIGVVVVLPWYVLVYQQHGWEYIRSFIVDENLLRYTQTVGGGGRGPFFYLSVMLDFLFPWSLFVPFALWIGARRARPWGDSHTVPQGSVEHRITLLLVLWVAVFVLFFSLSSTKQDLYILPVVPALAALIGRLLASGLEGSAAGTRPVTPRLLLATGAILPIVGAGLFALLVAPGKYRLAGVGTVITCLALGGLLAVGFTVRRRLLAATAAIAVAFVLVSWCFVLVTLPDFERYKPVRPLAGVISARASAVAVIGTYRLGVPSMVFYLHRPMLEWHEAQQVRDAFSSSSEVYALMSENDYQAIRDTLPVSARVVDARPMLDARLNHLLDDTALPQVVLVSNRSP